MFHFDLQKNLTLPFQLAFSMCLSKWICSRVPGAGSPASKNSLRFALFVVDIIKRVHIFYYSMSYRMPHISIVYVTLDYIFLLFTANLLTHQNFFPSTHRFFLLSPIPLTKPFIKMITWGLSVHIARWFAEVRLWELKEARIYLGM